METKVCNHCKTELPLSAFGLKKNGKPRWICRGCAKSISAERWKSGAERDRAAKKHTAAIFAALNGCPATSTEVSAKLGISVHTFTLAIKPSIESGEIVRVRKANGFTYWLSSEYQHEAGPPAKERKQDDDAVSDAVRREQIASKAAQETAWLSDLVKSGRRFSPFGVLIDRGLS